jgi:hypothetical protein
MAHKGSLVSDILGIKEGRAISSDYQFELLSLIQAKAVVLVASFLTREFS